MDETHITSLAAALTAEPGKREAQRDLARTLTLAVHGADALAKAERASAVLFGGSLAEADADDVLTVFDDVPSITVRRIDLEGAGLAAADAAVQATLVSSKGEANRLIKQGGLYVNDRRWRRGPGESPRLT